jgi:hypothetical protein
MTTGLPFGSEGMSTWQQKQSNSKNESVKA